MRSLVLGAVPFLLLSSVTLAAEVTSAASAGLGGPPVRGVCILNRAEVFASARVAKSVNDQYRKAFEAAQAEVTKERESLEADAKALVAKQASLEKSIFQAQQAELNTRSSQLQSKANAKTQDLETKRRAVVARIATEAQPVIEQVYKERGCGLLISRDAVLAGNMDMDITAAVIDQLDKKIVELPFAVAALDSKR